MGNMELKGETITRLRAKHGLTMEGLARLADVSTATVFRLESGRTIRGRTETRRRIARALGVDCPSSPNGTSRDGNTAK